MHLYKGLLELPLFSQAPRGLVRMLSLQVRPVYVGPGEYLLMQNDVVNCIYYIASGSMEVLQGESVAAILGQYSIISSFRFVAKHKSFLKRRHMAEKQS